jgi:hypothetical protein
MRIQRSANVLDVMERVLDRGVVIEAWVGVSLAGIHLVDVEARVLVASIATYVKLADMSQPRRRRSFARPPPLAPAVSQTTRGAALFHAAAPTARRSPTGWSAIKAAPSPVLVEGGGPSPMCCVRIVREPGAAWRCADAQRFEIRKRPSARCGRPERAKVSSASTAEHTMGSPCKLKEVSPSRSLSAT